MLSLAPEMLPDLNITIGLPVGVDDADWARLMRAPSLEALGEEMEPALVRVRDWATKHIRPYCTTRLLSIDQIEPDRVRLTDASVLPIGESFSRKLKRFDAESLIVMGFTLGHETDHQARRLWEEDRFEDSYLLSTYSAALAESMRSRYTQRLAKWSAARGWSLMTPEGPGYNDWPTKYLSDLFACLQAYPGTRLVDHMQVEPMGTLSPVQSMLITFGISHTDNPKIARQHETNPCSRCRLAGCALRRVPYERSSRARSTGAKSK